MAYHTAICTVRSCLRNLCCQCHLQKLKWHRIKCTKIITNVVLSALREECVQDIKGKSFSIMADESTDCTTEKYMVLVA